MWTLFWDMHSGGSLKIKPYHYIFIEAPEKEAELIFYNRFHRNPYRVTCTCCGEDYAVHESETFEQATEFHRRRRGTFLTVEEFMKEPDVLVITEDKITPSERSGDLPREGYVWV